MKDFYRTALYAAVIFFAITVKAQDNSLIQLHYAQQRLNDSVGVLTIKAIVPASTKLYTLQQNETTALYSSIDFDSTAVLKLDGTTAQSGNVHAGIDNSVNSKVWFVTDSVTWQQKIKATAGDSFIVKGKVDLLYNKNGRYHSDEKAFKIYIESEKNTAEASVVPEGFEPANLYGGYFLPHLPVDCLPCLRPVYTQ